MAAGKNGVSMLRDGAPRLLSMRIEHHDTSRRFDSTLTHSPWLPGMYSPARCCYSLAHGAIRLGMQTVQDLYFHCSDAPLDLIDRSGIAVSSLTEAFALDKLN